LLKNTLFNITVPKIIKAQQDEEQQFECPVPDFTIKSFRLHQGSKKSIVCKRPAILLLLKGKAMMQGKENEEVQAAAAFYVLPGETCNILAETDLYFVLASVA
jgi:mannose-6-phosphate isomerase class I